MIQRIRRKFISIAVLVLAVAMVLVTVIINVANWVSVRAELTDTLRYIAQHDGMMGQMMMGRGMRFGRSPRMGNMLLESRYFSALLSPNGIISLRDTSRDTDTDSAVQSEVAVRALQSEASGGYDAPYLYLAQAREDGSRLAVFLNVESSIQAVQSLALTSALACAGGILLAWLLVALFSSRAIRPLIENAVKQKEFITDAGHELKTPLSVISANMDVLSMDIGENEWVQSTQKQVSGMRDLVNQMVYLSRMDEDNARLQMSGFDLSLAVRETAEPFAAMAELSGSRLELILRDGLRMTGDEAAVRRLVSILCENAVKYAPSGDLIRLSAALAGRKVLIETENGMTHSVGEEDLKRMFDRFYRADESRSKEQGGFGIGLAIVRAVAEKHRGRVSARLVSGGRLRISCVLEKESRGG